MQLYQERLYFSTRGRGSLEITAEIAAVVTAAGVRQGLCHVFVHHTSASVLLCENADPTVRQDVEGFLSRLMPDGDPRYRHDDEGPDDMAAHLRTLLTHSDLSLPVSDGRLALGTWQGVYLWEHRTRPHRRQLTVTVLGNPDG